MTPERKTRVTTSTTIEVNGRTYSSVDEMEPEVRWQYEEAMRSLAADRDGNGVPDIFESPAQSEDESNVVIRSVSKRVVFNSKELGEGEDLPAEIRDAIRRSRIVRPAQRLVEHPPDAPPVRRAGEVRMSPQTLAGLIIAVAILSGAVVWLMR